MKKLKRDPPIQVSFLHPNQPTFLLQGLIETLEDGLIVVDVERRFVIVNQTAREILGLDPAEPLPERMADQFPLFRPDEVTPLPYDEHPLLRALRGERGHLDVFIRGARCPHGRWVDCTLSPLLDHQGNVTHGIVVFRDVTEQKHAAVELAENKRRLEQAQQVAHLGSWEWDLRDDSHVWSDELFRLFGLAPGAIRPSLEAFLACIHPEDRASVASAIEASLRGEHPFRLEYRTCHPDGTLHFLAGQGDVKLDAAGRPRRFLGVTQDRTEQKRAEAALADKTSKLRAVVDNTTDAVFIKDLEGRYLLVNPACAAVVGAPIAQILGTRDEDHFPPEAVERYRRIDRQVAETGCLVTVEEFVQRDAEGRRYFSSVRAPYTSHRGEPLGVIGISRDITDEKRAQEALCRSREQLDEAQHIAALGSWEWDIRTGRMRWSDGFYRILREGPQSFEPSLAAFLARVHPDDRPGVEARLAGLANSGQAIDHEYRVVLPNGAVRTFHGRGRMALWSDDGSSKAIGTAQDVTERKQIEQQLRRQYEALTELDRLKSHFVNAVTHELRTPLTSVKGYAEFLEDDVGGELTDQQREYVQQLTAGAKRLENILGDMLDYARIEAGTFRVVPEPAELNDKVREILESLRPQASAAQVQLELCLTEPPLQVSMDAQRIGQVLLNLLGNAIKFTPAGGTVRVRTMGDARVVRCQVEDTGPGIAPGDIGRLFTRFTQLEAGQMKRVGIGLGLSIAKSIIEAHGGHIGVESEPGRGSTFWFTLPRPAEPTKILPEAAK